jgi:hypothetical protein
MTESDRLAGLFDDADWRKSRRCANGACVEVALREDLVALRDSKDRLGPILVFSRSEWEAFTGGVQSGEFDLPA